MASRVAQLLDVARSELGKPYVYGADGPSSFDCSGLTQFVYGAIGIQLPRTAAQQQDATTPTRSPQPGDLVFYGDPAHHVGLYIGGGQMIAAPHAGDVVKVQAVYGSPAYGRVPGSGAATAPVVDAATAGLTTAGPAGTGFGTALRSLGLQLAFVAAGGALIVIGLRQAVSPTIRRTLEGVTP